MIENTSGAARGAMRNAATIRRVDNGAGIVARDELAGGIEEIREKADWVGAQARNYFRVRRDAGTIRFLLGSYPFVSDN